MGYVSLALALLIGFGSAAVRAEDLPVDLVLAIDISLSMDVDEQRVQREGYQAALIDPAVLKAIADGAYRRIALAYVEWAGSVDQQVTVDWRLIEGKTSAEEVVIALAARPLRRRQWTSISSALGVPHEPGPLPWSARSAARGQAPAGPEGAE